VENGRGVGVKIEGRAEGITVYGCHIRENGHHGVSLTGLPPGQPDANKRHRVENNHIHHCGRLVGHGYGVEISQSGHNQILHNHIHHMPRYGVSIKGVRYQVLKEQAPGVTFENRHDFLHGRNNRIAFNHIHHVNQDSQDTGAFESWGPGRDNVIDHNRIHDTGNDRFDLQSGIYLDDATDYFTVTNNILYNVRGAGGDQPIYAKGIGNRVENNVLIVHASNAGAIRSFSMAASAPTTMSTGATSSTSSRRRRAACPSAAPGGAASATSTTREPRSSWRVFVPADGAYDVYLRYAADNTGAAAPMDHRTTLAVDGGPAVPLVNLPNTGGWGTQAWSPRPSARLELTRASAR
jgi:hypothetical protein